jgi:hypothetical protein
MVQQRAPATTGSIIAPFSEEDKTGICWGQQARQPNQRSGSYQAGIVQRPQQIASGFKVVGQLQGDAIRLVTV